MLWTLTNGICSMRVIPAFAPGSFRKSVSPGVASQNWAGRLEPRQSPNWEHRVQRVVCLQPVRTGIQEPQMKTRILLADDHQIVRQGLRSLLDQHPDMEVVGEAEDGRSAVEMADELKPDVVIMDVGMPGLNGVEATRQVGLQDARTKVVALSMHSDRRFVGEMLKAGAKGYLLKDGAFEELANAIRTVQSNRVYLSPKIANFVVEDYIRQRPETPGRKSAYASITPREREVLQLFAEGQSTKQVAATLHLSVKTVETHRRQIMEKLQIFSVAELTKFAIREGITSAEY
jgi:DNA-binding NarL/FixJ family response regulator